MLAMILLTPKLPLMVSAIRDDVSCARCLTRRGRKLNAFLNILNRVVVTPVTKAASLPKVVKYRLITPN